MIVIKIALIVISMICIAAFIVAFGNLGNGSGTDER